MFNLVLEKAEEPQIKLPTSVGSSKKQESSKKNLYFCFMDNVKPLTMWTTIDSGKFLKKWEYQTTLPVSWGACMQSKKQQDQTWKNSLAPIWEKDITRLYIATLLI